MRKVLLFAKSREPLKARQAEEREALGEVDQRRVRTEPLARGLEPLG